MKCPSNSSGSGLRSATVVRHQRADHPPLPTSPQVQAFVVCREVWHDPRTNEFVITGPVSHVPIPAFPADIRLSVYAHVTGGHGTYPMRFELRAADGDTVWQWTPADPLDHPDPLKP
jgi:hypothetical protein